MRNIILASVALCALSVAGCATPTVVTPSGKTAVSDAKVGADAVQVGNLINLAAALYSSQGGANATVVSDAQQAGAALIAGGQALENSTATTGDLHANIQAGYDALNAMLTSLATVSPSTATRITGYRDALIAAVGLYNADAAQAGLPTVTLPTS